MEFQELICYSQVVILFLLALGYFINLRRTSSELPKKAEKKCSACGHNIKDENVNYCVNCGELISHSTGLPLEK